MNGANKKSEAELNQLCQAFLFNLQFIKGSSNMAISVENVILPSIKYRQNETFPDAKSSARTLQRR